MAQNRRLETDQEFNEAMDKQALIRIFKDDHIIDSGVVITRFDDQTIVVQSGVSGLFYYPRTACEFFETKQR
ncbi:hypothetical protein [Paenibacillus periandrae]|uniref:hypothetical protein n=1 Tax=Paenibacillus periandrae TaxID=1761741 RepID=UPI001F094C4A|nr:hypothetical protein [Paenibacillus periandrae]